MKDELLNFTGSNFLLGFKIIVLLELLEVFLSSDINTICFILALGVFILGIFFI